MKRRIIAVLAAAALTATLGAGVAPAVAAQPDGAAIVALGDSVASGNGILPYIKDDEPLCLRSKKSYPMLLGKQFGMSVATEACSGEGTAAAAGQLQEALAEHKLGSDTQVVTLTVGVNDVMWQLPGTPVLGWGEALVACSDAGVFPAEACGPALYLSGQSLSVPPPSPPAPDGTPALPGRIALLVQAIRAQAPAADIVVTGYPVLFGEGPGMCNVGLLDAPAFGVRKDISYSQGARIAINQAVMGANALIAAGAGAVAAFDTKVHYVDPNVGPGGFDGHGLCDTSDAWISGLFPATAQPRDRGFHPNPPGQRAYAALVAGALGW